MTNHQLAITFFAQLAVILLATKFIGALSQKLGQPQVVGEMIAGVVLGPSLLSGIFPSFQSHLFPKETMGTLYVVAQIGLVLYMFVVGLEFNVSLIKSKFRSALSISLAGILAPFALGALIAVYLVKTGGLFHPSTTYSQGILFMGAAMSVTAFPMLARIILERGLAGTSMGTLALAAGSVDDAFAWCFLAIVTATFSNSPLAAIVTILGGAAYVAIAAIIFRPILLRIATSYSLSEEGKTVISMEELRSKKFLCSVAILLGIGAWFTDLVGIYSVFGAFILGVTVPRGTFNIELKKLIEPIAVNLFLPFFFIYSGLNTDLPLLVNPSMMIIAFLIIFAACIGKGGACWLAARLTGESQGGALRIGALMNARGLMELILLNIGLEHGIITPALFSIMVMMAIISTLMASPWLKFIDRRYPLNLEVPDRLFAL